MPDYDPQIHEPVNGSYPPDDACDTWGEPIQGGHAILITDIASPYRQLGHHAQQAVQQMRNSWHLDFGKEAP